MSIESPEVLDYDGHTYLTSDYPLESYLKGTGSPVFEPIWPSRYRGYNAIWSMKDGSLFLTELAGIPNSHNLFPAQATPIPAIWYSGLVHAYRGTRRETGYPSRSFHEHEVLFKVDQGKILCEWVLDLRSIPGQTDEEIRQSLPAFLWPERFNQMSDD
jgi:hypothetical protein